MFIVLKILSGKTKYLVSIELKIILNLRCYLPVNTCTV